MKRLLTIILSAAMAVTLMPMAAFADSSFKDVSRGAWYKTAVDYVASNGIMNGVGDNRFDPDANLTRGMIVQMLYNLEGRPSGAADAGFSDVNSGAWYRDAVNWAAENNVVSGYGNARFGPEDAVTREQVASILYRFSRYKGYDVSANEPDLYNLFTDASQISDWAFGSIDWTVAANIINGVGNGILNPAGTATRAQVAQILKNYMEAIVNKDRDKKTGAESDWNAVTYTIKTDDRSRPNLSYSFDYIQITDKNYP